MRRAVTVGAWLVVASACSFGGSSGSPRDASVDGGIDGGVDGGAGPADRFDCSPLPAASGTIIAVADVSELEEALSTAAPGTTLSLADGLYRLQSAVVIATDGLQIRSASGDPAGVILSADSDGNGFPDFNRLLSIEASDVTIAEVTLRDAPTPLFVTGSATADTSGVVLYRLTVIDFEDRGLEITLRSAQFVSDGGLLACSRFEGETAANCSDFTAAVDIRAAVDDWRVTENVFGPFCLQTLSTISQLAVRASRLTRFTVVDHNTSIGARDGMKFGVASPPSPACDGASGAGWDDYGALVCNNLLVYDEGGGTADQGIDFFHACDATVVNNTIAWSSGPSDALVFGGDGTEVSHANNAMTGGIDADIGSPSFTTPELSDLQTSAFTSFPTDMTLAASVGTSSRDISGIESVARFCSWDLDGNPRDLAAPGFGAYAP